MGHDHRLGFQKDEMLWRDERTQYWLGTIYFIGTNQKLKWLYVRLHINSAPDFFNIFHRTKTECVGVV